MATGREYAAGDGYYRSVAYPIEPPIEPMLAKPQPEIPIGDGWRYEPKWDGFRALVFRDGAEVYIQSRDLKPLNRYFPELEEPLRRIGRPSDRFVLDGEIVIASDGGLNFDALLLRIHPAASRVAMLAEASPSSYVAFDLLAEGDARPPRRALRQAPDRRSSGGWRSRRHRSCSPRRRMTRRPPSGGSTCSRARASTAWWPSGRTFGTCPGSGR